MKYVQIAEPIFRDLIDAKSKVTDIKMLVDDYAIQLDRMGFLHDIRAILYGERYSTKDTEKN